MRKKTITLIFLSLLTLTTLGCSSQPATSDPTSNMTPNTLTLAELTPRESTFIGLINEGESFVFDYGVDSTYQQSSIWIECYEKDTLTTTYGPLSCPLDSAEDLIVATLDQPINQEVPFVLSLAGGILRGKGEFPLSQTENFATTWAENTNENIAITEEPIILGIMLCQSIDTVLESPAQALFTDYDVLSQVLAKTDVTYLVKCQFTKDAPAEI